MVESPLLRATLQDPSEIIWYSAKAGDKSWSLQLKGLPELHHKQVPDHVYFEVTIESCKEVSKSRMIYELSLNVLLCYVVLKGR